MASRRARTDTIVLIASVLAALVVYGWLVPRHLMTGTWSRAVLYLVVGWVPYTLAFYAAGRGRAATTRLPSMRAADIGLALFLVALLLSLGLEAWGFTPERVPTAHVLQAIGIFVGLALFGWGIGRRSAAISTLRRDTE